MRIMMFAHGGSLNRGCEAIVRSSTGILKEKMAEVQISLLSDLPETDRIIGNLDHIYDASPVRLSKYSPQWLVGALRIRLLKDESYSLGKMYRNVISRLGEADVFMSIGGDNYCYGEQPALYEINSRIKRKGGKLVLWGCSIGEEDISARKLEDLRKFDLILARETLTYDLLQKNGLKSARLVADPAFTMTREELPLPAGWLEGNTVGLNFSPLVMKRNQASQQAFHELIRHILDHTDMTIALTPHVIEDGNNDWTVLNDYYQLYKDTGRVLLLPDHLTAVQYKGYIARMRFFVGARTHATIAAYSSGVPTMVLGYSVKSKGIAKDIFGTERLVLGIDEISDGRKLIGQFDEMLKDEEEIRETLRLRIPQIKEMSYKAVDYLKEMA